VLLLGTADSMANSLMVLFAADEAHLSPWQVGVFVSASGVGGIVISSFVGRRFDRRPTRRYAIAVTAIGAVGYVLLSRTTSFPLLILLALTLIGSLASAFPQLFALARVVLGDGKAGLRSAPLLRSGWSLAWAIGPLAGAALLARTSFATLFVAVAVVLALSTVAVSAVPSPGRSGVYPQPAGTAPQEPPSVQLPRATVVLLTLSVTLFFTAMFAGSVALPLFVTRELNQPDSAVAVLYSVCAVVEIVAAIGLVALPAWVSQRWLILGGTAVFVGYFAITVVADGMELLLIGQAARGTAIAVVGSAGIRYFQDAMAPATGRATTLFMNAGSAGLLVAGVLAGFSVQSFGTTPTLLLCAVTAVASALAFYAGSMPGFSPAALVPSA
jgi:SET family sugar efflux transporter-like MFS transporter